jgi:cell division protein FtsI (penicillin-binding protein 3)
VAWGLLALGRLVWLQVVEHDELAKLAESQQIQELELKAPRGAILDRHGGLLAVSEPVDSAAINPRRLQDATVAAELLGRILELKPEPLLKRIQAARERGRGFLWVKRKITREESEQLRALKAGWIDLREESRRVYPKGTLAAHVLGSVDHREQGNAGIELSLEGELAGRPGYVQVLTDVRHNGIDTRAAAPPQPGKTVALTLDERLQYICERELAKAVEENGCATGTVMVMDPRNGDVLALASYPTYDPNRPPRTRGEAAARANVAVGYACEPGSVFKIFTVAAALETTRLREGSIINCGRGSINLYGQVIHDTHAWEALRMEEVLWHSSNIGAVNIGLTVGKEKLHEYLRRFGFGKATGIALPGESAGTLRAPEKWTTGSIGYVAFGHEVSATTVQLGQAASAIANGGYLVTPRLVRWKRRPGGSREFEAAERVARVVEPETAIRLRKMMEGVVLYGTGKKARLAGYTSGGKTGTAQIFDLASRAYTKRYNSSFVGMAPLNDPSVVVVVTLNGATKYGGVVSAPVFKTVTSAALRLMGVTRDLPYAEPAVAKAAAESLAAGPAPAPVEPYAGEAGGLLVGPLVPDWKGKSVKAVLRESMEIGVPVEIVGTGLARMQSPPAGRVLGVGEKIRVEFAR